MRKILAIILTVFMILTMLASCVKNSDVVEKPTENNTKESVEAETEKVTEKATEEIADKENSASNDNNEQNSSNSEQDTNQGDANQGDESKEEIPAVLYTRDGNKVTFGSYPQAKVSDATLIDALNKKAGNLPTQTQSNNWTSYKYFAEKSQADYMWYIDIVEGGEKYRGVYFTAYRPMLTSEASSSDTSWMDNYGYLLATIYWFKYEPISWTILKEDTENGTALLLCDMIIDSQAYQNEYEMNTTNYNRYNTSEGVPSGTFANNYAYSTIRKWLNESFLSTAFNTYQQQIISTVLVDNSASTTSAPASNPNACENTNDKIFLLSYQDIINSEYGFGTQYSQDAFRIKKPTDYALSQGGWADTNEATLGNGSWILRSPDNGGTATVRLVTALGYDYSLMTVDNTYSGIVPALQITFN